MKSTGMPLYLRIGLIIVGILVIGGGVFVGIDYLSPAPATPEVSLPQLETPTPIPTASATPLPTPSATIVSASPTPTVTPRPKLPTGGIVYALSPDINSVGWVQAEETGNHFGESFLYAGIREGISHLGAMQFDLSFIPKGATIFSAELEITGIAAEGLTSDAAFGLNLLAEEIDPEWSRHDFETIHTATVDEAFTPVLEASDLSSGRTNKFIFNAAQRSIIEDRLETSHRISFRLDGLSAEGWFGWDSGYGEDSQGQGPILRLGVVPPVATDVAEVPAGSTPTSTPTFVMITSTPTPENILTVAAVAPTATYEATTIGTVTPLPENWVTPWAVTSTPTPENTATALFQWAEATAAVIAFGTPTATPQNMVTATPEATDTPTPVFILMDGELPPMTPTPTPVATLGPTPPIPAELMGKIVFKSDRTGQEEFYVINPDGTELALLTNRWPYNMANLADMFSADGRYRVFTKDTIRYRNISDDAATGETQVEREDIPALYWYDSFYKIEEQLTEFGAGIAYSGVWSPLGNQIAFVSNDSGNDEIWVINPDGSDPRQLTRDEFNWWDKHPSWSPDGSQIVFWSNRTGHGQIWVMNADGSNLYSLSRTGFNDYDPVWIKYPGLPPDALKKHTPYIGPYDPSGSDKNCEDFNPEAEFYESAQTFYWAAGGPARDPHELDANNDGIACN